MISFKYPTSLKIDAVELEDGVWRVCYEEGFKSEHLEAFKTSITLIKELAKDREEFTITLDEENCLIYITLKAPMGVVFSFLCGEFMGLSNIGRLTIMDLFVRSAIGSLDISGKNIKG